MSLDVGCLVIMEFFEDSNLDLFFVLFIFPIMNFFFLSSFWCCSVRVEASGMVSARNGLVARAMGPFQRHF